MEYVEEVGCDTGVVCSWVVFAWRGEGAERVGTGVCFLGRGVSALC